MLCAIGVHAQKLKINTVPEGLQKGWKGYGTYC